jgi:glycosyltransferase involved in cell wall biosynthesis
LPGTSAYKFNQLKDRQLKKVVFLSAVHTYDDTRVLHKEARSLAENGYSVTHLCPHTEDSRRLFPSGDTRVSGVRIQFYSLSSSWLIRAFGIFRLLAAAKRERAEIFHCNEPESWIAGCFLKLFCRPRPKVIFDVHEHYPSRFDEPHIPRLVALVGKPFLKACFKILPRVTDHFILAKRSIAPDFRNHAEKCSYIFNYSPSYFLDLDVAEEDPFRERKNEGQVVFIHVGVFSRTRGWPQILDAMALAKNEKVALIGMGRVAEGEEAIYARAAELGIRDRVEVLAPKPYDKMFEYLRHADVGLMLYQPGIMNHVYAFPMKMYDYMAAALPVIGPDFAVEVVPVVEEEACGHLVDTSSADQLAASIDWFCDNPEARRNMGNRGRKAVETKYTWDKEAEKLLAIYQGLSS